MTAALLGACTSVGARNNLVTPPPDDSPPTPDADPPPATGGSRAPMGASTGTAGTTFRVWAPHATAVFVEGDFNAWSPDANPLAAVAGGVFAATVANVGAGAHYRYLLQTPSGPLLRRDPRALAVSPDLSDSVVYDPQAFAWTDQAFHPPPKAAQVIYELHLATFVDVSGGGTGTWTSAATKLDYLQALGVNMIEVLPPAQFPGAYSWGYNPVFPFAPEANYGSPDELKRFVDQAHARGLGVIVDVVHNHWGPSDLPMWCFDGPCFGDGNGGIYFYTDARRETGFGPRPDYGRPEIRDLVVDNAMMWLRDYHADGLRWDSTVNMRRAGGQDLPDGWALLQRINDAVDAVAPDKVMIAEDLQNDARITKPTAMGGTGFDAQWDPSLFHPVKDALVATDDAVRDMHAVANAINGGFHGGPMERVIFTEDHDQVSPQNGPTNLRICALVAPDSPGGTLARKRATLGATIVLTAPGIPMLFMGQEFLESLPFPFRQAAALDWSKADANTGIVQMFRDLVKLRRNAGGASRGLTGAHTDVFHVNDAAKVIAFRRWDSGGPGDEVIVLANFSAKPFPRYLIGLPAAGTWHVRFNGDTPAYSPDFGSTPSDDVVATPTPRDGQPFMGAAAVGAYAAVILSQ